MTPGSVILELENVSHSYDGVRVIDRASLTVRAGEIFCLLGPSGCGKSTTLRLVAGLEELQSGIIRLRGQVVAEGGRGQVPPESRGVGMVFQDHALFPHLTVFQNVVFGLSGLSAAEQGARAEGLLARIGMPGAGNVYPHTLSGGQQQRVALARAMAPEPTILLMDEPFSGLDTGLRSAIREDALALLRESGATALLVTHDPEEAMYVSDRIAVMRNGRIEQVGSPEDVYCRPASPFVARFFSSVNRTAGTVQGGRVPTPFGPIPAAGFKDGEQVVVLSRPEALRIMTASSKVPDCALGVAEGTVVQARILRRSVFTHLDMGIYDGKPLRMRSRNAGHDIPAEGSRVRVWLDPAQTFIFPRSAEDAGGPVMPGPE